MTPSELPSGTDRVACAARNFLGRDFDDDDILVNVQGDEPLIDPALVEQLAQKLKDDPRWSMATAVTPIRSAEDFADDVSRGAIHFDDPRLEELFFRFRARNYPETLTDGEKAEREALRAEYLAEWRRGAIAVLENTYVQTPDGAKRSLRELKEQKKA